MSDYLIYAPPYDIKSTNNMNKYDVKSLFMSPANVKKLCIEIHKRRELYGVNATYNETVGFVRNKVRQFIKREFRDCSSSANQHETLSYYNYQFIKLYAENTKPYIHRVGDLVPDENPFKLKPYGKSIDRMNPIDYHVADVWQENPVFMDAYNSRQFTGIKGMRNPHIIGAHKRHYYRDNTEGLRLHEKGPERTSGYGHHMQDIYKYNNNNDTEYGNSEIVDDIDPNSLNFNSNQIYDFET